jgi:YggT family protein
VLLVCNLLTVYLLLVFGRIILSWFPLAPGGAMAGVFNVVYTVTEPVLGPLRRVIPPLGAFDLSPLVLVIGIQVLQQAVFRC